MRKPWPTRALGEVCYVIGGGTPPKDRPDYYGGEVPWATVRDMRSDVICDTEFRITNAALSGCATNVIPKGSVVIATRVGLGKVCLLGQDTAINQDLRGIVPMKPNNLLSKFLFWWFKSIDALIVAEGTGATVQGVKLPFVKALRLPVPPVSEQQRIVGILDEAFEGIATAKAHDEKNLQNARAIFESHLDSVFLRRDTWTAKSVDELVREGVLYKPFDGNHGELHPRAADYVTFGVPFIMASDLHDGLVDTANCRFIPESLAQSLRVGFAKDGDVLLSHKGTIGRSAILKTTDEYVMLTPQVTAYRIRDPKALLNRFIRYYFMTGQFQREMISGAEDGSTRAYIGITKQLSLNFRFPSLEIQHQIIRSLDALAPEGQLLENLYRQKLAALAALKKSLLHEAFSGKL